MNRYAQIGVRTNHYSEPARLIGRQVRVVLHASDLVIYDHDVEVAQHERLIGKAQERCCRGCRAGRCGSRCRGRACRTRRP
ncbi:Mu transposase domain-containing protein [Streptomyces sp. NPDC050658]|uniref:Mu transposase domain-containing protein n=1 Tax=Streptomyces sp. NPDC050658 TaxID=3365633 RepID=UPI0037AA516B